MYKYHQNTGHLEDATGKLMGIGYSGGDAGRRPEGINNADMQYEPMVGPLPRGIYTMGEPVEGTHLGPLAIPLHPDPANEMFGRSAFYIHGDHIGLFRVASDGCMIFARNVREQLVASDDKQLEVVR